MKDLLFRRGIHVSSNTHTACQRALIAGAVWKRMARIRVPSTQNGLTGKSVREAGWPKM